MDAGTLNDAISAVCPVVYVRVDDPNDRATWTFIPAGNATGPQITAGNNVVNTIDPTVKNTLLFMDFLTRWTNPEYTALLTSRGVANNVGMTKRWDVMEARGIVDMNKQATATVKSDLVAAGVLTQVRADAIFS